jgi:hypothetical protein
MVDRQWLEGFQQTVGEFKRRREANGDVVSIKVRIESGCFHREHSPEAFKIIDARLRSLPENLEAIEHESGPELLLYLAVGTGVLSLAKSVVELVPLVLIVRRVDEKNDYREDVVLRIGHTDKVDSGVIEDQLNASIRELFKDNV